MSPRITAAVLGGAALVSGGLGLAFAPSASAAPSPTTTPTVAPSVPGSALPIATPSPVATLPNAPGTAPIAVPAGNARLTVDNGANDIAAIVLLGAGGLLIAGGVTVARRNR